MVHKVTTLQSEMSVSESVGILQQWRAIAEQAVRDGSTNVFVTQRRTAFPRRMTCVLECSTIIGHVVTAECRTDASGLRYVNVTALFPAAAVAAWCNSKVAGLLAPNN